jgi:hypothetical protein
MKNNTALSSLSSSALLDLLGLESKPSAGRRMMTYAGFVAAGVVMGAAAAMLLTPRTGPQLRTDIHRGAKVLGTEVGNLASRATGAVRAAMPEAGIDQDGRSSSGA